MYKFLDSKGEHLHTLREKPLIGTTTLLKEVHPPMLSWYGSGKALELFGWLNAKLFSSEERLKSATAGLAELQNIASISYLAKLDAAYKNHNEFKKEAGKKGTDTHKKVEKYIKYCIAEFNGEPRKITNEDISDIQDFADWAFKEVKQFLWSEGYCYSEKLWVGGCADFGFISKDKKIIIGDYKTAKDIYWTNFLQTAGYGLLIKENGVLTTDGTKLLHPEKIDGYVVFQQKNKKDKSEPKILWAYNMEELEKIFEVDVLTYRLMRNFKNGEK